MTDSRAALEERARKFLGHEIRQAIQRRIDDMEEGDWESYEKWKRHAFNAYRDLIAAERESSSLKLLLSTICKGKAGIEWKESAYVEAAKVFIVIQYARFPVELDSSGIPVLTPEILEALKNAK